MRDEADVRLTTVGIVVGGAARLAVGSKAAVGDSLVPADVHPGAIAKNIATLKMKISE